MLPIKLKLKPMMIMTIFFPNLKISTLRHRYLGKGARGVGGAKKHFIHFLSQFPLKVKAI